MSVQLVIEHIVNKRGLSLNTLVDKDFSQLTWLFEVEGEVNEQGERTSKSYYCAPTIAIHNKIKYFIKGEELSQGLKEAIRITYDKVYETVNGIENVFVGIRKRIYWVDWSGAIKDAKYDKTYYFKLEPILENEIVVGYSSLKMRKILIGEHANLEI